jgi:hypothetical protein
MNDICEKVCPCEQCDCEEEDCELAKAYGKQVAKKPQHDCGGYYCPHCHEWIDELDVGEKYCENCGGALDWECKLT